LFYRIADIGLFSRQGNAAGAVRDVSNRLFLNAYLIAVHALSKIRIAETSSNSVTAKMNILCVLYSGGEGQLCGSYCTFFRRQAHMQGIDTDEFYGTEPAVGKAIARAIKVY